MKPHQTKPICISCLLFFLVLFSHYSTSVTAQEVEDEREFDYLQGSGKGPTQWGSIKEEWAACKNGDMQSPIDLSSQRVKLIPHLGKLNTTYKPSNGTLKNRGHDIAIEWIGNPGSVNINGTEYSLKQCHWHSPSEHSINGSKYAMELHMVHQSPDPNVTNNVAVVGAVYKIGLADPFLSLLASDIKSMTDQTEERSIGMIDPAEIKISGNNYYRYMGSLTIPPCTEGVIWTIDKEIRTVSRDQVKLFRAAVHDYAETNARPLQSLNLREIQSYDKSERIINN